MNWYFLTLWFLESAFTVIRVSWWFLFVLGVIDDECTFSFWHIKVFVYYVCSFFCLCCSLLEGGIKRVVKISIYFPVSENLPTVFQKSSEDLLKTIVFDDDVYLPYIGYFARLLKFSQPILNFHKVFGVTIKGQFLLKSLDRFLCKWNLSFKHWGIQSLSDVVWSHVWIGESSIPLGLFNEFLSKMYQLTFLLYGTLQCMILLISWPSFEMPNHFNTVLKSTADSFSVTMNKSDVVYQIIGKQRIWSSLLL